MLSQGHMGASLCHYTSQAGPRFENSGSLGEGKCCNYVMFEADIHLRPRHTSILDIFKVFDPLLCCPKGIPDLDKTWDAQNYVLRWLKLGCLLNQPFNFVGLGNRVILT